MSALALEEPGPSQDIALGVECALPEGFDPYAGGPEAEALNASLDAMPAFRLEAEGR